MREDGINTTEWIHRHRWRALAFLQQDARTEITVWYHTSVAPFAHTSLWAPIYLPFSLSTTGYPSAPFSPWPTRWAGCNTHSTHIPGCQSACQGIRMEGPLLLYKVLLLFSQPLYDWKVNEDLCSSHRDFTHKKIPHLFSFTSDKVDLWAQELIDKDTDFFIIIIIIFFGGWCIFLTFLYKGNRSSVIRLSIMQAWVLSVIILHY